MRIQLPLLGEWPEAVRARPVAANDDDWPDPPPARAARPVAPRCVTMAIADAVERMQRAA